MVDDVRPAAFPGTHRELHRYSVVIDNLTGIGRHPFVMRNAFARAFHGPVPRHAAVCAEFGSDPIRGRIIFQLRS